MVRRLLALLVGFGGCVRKNGIPEVGPRWGDKAVAVSSLGEVVVVVEEALEPHVPNNGDLWANRVKIMAVPVNSTSLVEQSAGSKTQWMIMKSVKAGDSGLKFPWKSMQRIVKRNPPPKFLQGGSFGQTFLAMDITGTREEVIKMFYFNAGTDERPRNKWLTSSDCRERMDLQEQVSKAADECELARHFNDEATNPAYTGKGRNRIMDCYGSNIGTGVANAPLYLILEHCGEDMRSFINKHQLDGTLTLDIVLSLFKQLLEALEYLQSFSEPYVHHDLKPENIVIKTSHTRDGKLVHTLHLIDLGEMVQVKDKNSACRVTAVTPGYVGQEYAVIDENSCQWTGGMVNYHPKYPKKFDMFAVGSILLDMLTGVDPIQLVEKVNEAMKEPLPLKATTEIGFQNMELVDKLTQQNDFVELAFDISLKVPPLLSANAMIEELRDGRHIETLRFIKEAVKCISSAPEDRPSVGDLIHDPIMESIETPEATAQPDEYARCQELEKALKESKLRYIDGRSDRKPTGGAIVEGYKFQVSYKRSLRRMTAIVECTSPKWRIVG